jgi:membrane protein YdbS with pleckstrin-like domain
MMILRQKDQRRAKENPESGLCTITKGYLVHTKMVLPINRTQNVVVKELVSHITRKRKLQVNCTK